MTASSLVDDFPVEAVDAICFAVGDARQAAHLTPARSACG